MPGIGKGSLGRRSSPTGKLETAWTFGIACALPLGYKPRSKRVDF
jgi:hypothetical protein